jgi:hypothetical protein
MSNKEGKLVQRRGSTPGLGYVHIWTRTPAPLSLSGHILRPTRHFREDYIDEIMKTSFRMLPKP